MSKKDEMKKLVKEAIQEFKKENQLQQKKQVYHNTRLLLRHYNDLQEHIDRAVDEIRQLELDEIDCSTDEDEVYIASIKRSKIKTMIMVAHIEISLESLKQKQAKNGTPERYRALELHYFEGKTYEEIQEILYCGINTPGRWINQMVTELSVFLFGIDGIKMIV